MAAEGKRNVVADLAASHGEHLRRFLVNRVRNRFDIPDIIQEVFLRLLRVPDQGSIRSPQAYLFTVARRVAQQHMLREAAAPPSMDLQQLLIEPAGDADPSLEVSAHESMERLEAALQELTPKARSVFLFHRRDGLTLQEIGSRLGVSRPMAKKYLAKALLEFRRRLAAQ